MVVSTKVVLQLWVGYLILISATKTVAVLSGAKEVYMFCLGKITLKTVS
jgi:hypothetical protein